MDPPPKDPKPIGSISNGSNDNSNKENDVINNGPPSKPPKPTEKNTIISDTSIKNESKQGIQNAATPKQVLNPSSTKRSPQAMSPLKTDDKVYIFCFTIRTKAAEAKMEVLSYLKSIYNGIIIKEGDKLLFDQFLKGLNKVKLFITYINTKINTNTNTNIINTKNKIR